MDLFTRLFGNLLVLVYHCFDRIVIHGYLSGLSRPEQVVHFVRQVHGIPVVSKEVLSQRTHAYQTLGGGLCPPSSDPDGMGPEGSSERRLCSARAPPSGEAECVWSVLHLQKHGTGPDLSYQHAEVPHERPPPPHLGAPAQPLYALLFLYPG